MSRPTDNHEPRVPLPWRRRSREGPNPRRRLFLNNGAQNMMQRSRTGSQIEWCQGFVLAALVFPFFLNNRTRGRTSLALLHVTRPGTWIEPAIHPENALELWVLFLNLGCRESDVFRRSQRTILLLLGIARLRPNKLVPHRTNVVFIVSIGVVKDI